MSIETPKKSTVDQGQQASNKEIKLDLLLQLDALSKTNAMRERLRAERADLNNEVSDGNEALNRFHQLSKTEALTNSQSSDSGHKAA